MEQANYSWSDSFIERFNEMDENTDTSIHSINTTIPFEEFDGEPRSRQELEPAPGPSRLPPPPQRKSPRRVLDFGPDPPQQIDAEVPAMSPVFAWDTWASVRAHAHSRARNTRTRARSIIRPRFPALIGCPGPESPDSPPSTNFYPSESGSVYDAFDSDFDTSEADSSDVSIVTVVRARAHAPAPPSASSALPAQNRQYPNDEYSIENQRSLSTIYEDSEPERQANEDTRTNGNGLHGASGSGNGSGCGGDRAGAKDNANDWYTSAEYARSLPPEQYKHMRGLKRTLKNRYPEGLPAPIPLPVDDDDANSAAVTAAPVADLSIASSPTSTSASLQSEIERRIIGSNCIREEYYFQERHANRPRPRRRPWPWNQYPFAMQDTSGHSTTGESD